MPRKGQPKSNEPIANAYGHTGKDWARGTKRAAGRWRTYNIDMEMRRLSDALHLFADEMKDRQPDMSLASYKELRLLAEMAVTTKAGLLAGGDAHGKLASLADRLNKRQQKMLGKASRFAPTVVPFERLRTMADVVPANGGAASVSEHKETP